jgi:DNA-binding MarR family transcriptional regulator
LLSFDHRVAVDTSQQEDRPVPSSTVRSSYEQGLDLETIARLRLAISRIGRRMRVHGGVGPTSSQVSALATVEKYGPLRIGDLAYREGVAAPTMTRVVAALDQLGYLERKPDPDDRRSSQVGISAAGRDLLETLRRDRTAYLANRVATLTESERAQLVTALPILEALAADETSP